MEQFNSSRGASLGGHGRQFGLAEAQRRLRVAENVLGLGGLQTDVNGHCNQAGMEARQKQFDRVD